MKEIKNDIRYFCDGNIDEILEYLEVVPVPLSESPGSVTGIPYRLCNRQRGQDNPGKEKLHHDPNLNYAVSVAFVLTRLPMAEKLTPIEMMKLAAGKVAGEKSIKTLAEVIDMLNHEPDITGRFGQGISIFNPGDQIIKSGVVTNQLLHGQLNTLFLALMSPEDHENIGGTQSFTDRFIL